MMACAPKSRAGYHFAAAIGFDPCLRTTRRRSRPGQRSTHTRREKLGRGLEHFRKEGARLIPPPTADDPYEDEAYRLWGRGRQYRATYSKTVRCTRTTIRLASALGCMSKRTSIMLEEVIKLHWFAGISPEQSFTEAGRHCEAVVAAD